MSVILKRASTAITSLPARVVAASFGAFSVVVAVLQLSPISTLVFLPLPALAAYAIARKVRGLPPTLAGEMTGLSSRADR